MSFVADGTQITLCSSPLYCRRTISILYLYFLLITVSSNIKYTAVSRVISSCSYAKQAFRHNCEFKDFILK